MKVLLESDLTDLLACGQTPALEITDLIIPLTYSGLLLSDVLALIITAETTQ